jgi:hypothetical protein
MKYSFVKLNNFALFRQPSEVLWFLFHEYKTITLLENNIKYEPLINARLAKVSGCDKIKNKI